MDDVSDVVVTCSKPSPSLVRSSRLRMAVPLCGGDELVLGYAAALRPATAARGALLWLERAGPEAHPTALPALWELERLGSVGVQPAQEGRRSGLGRARGDVLQHEVHEGLERQGPEGRRGRESHGVRPNKDHAFPHVHQVRCRISSALDIRLHIFLSLGCVSYLIYPWAAAAATCLALALAHARLSFPSLLFPNTERDARPFFLTLAGWFGRRFAN